MYLRYGTLQKALKQTTLIDKEVYKFKYKTNFKNDPREQNKRFLNNVQFLFLKD